MSRIRSKYSGKIHSAFTLVEILVVVVIIGMISAIVIPQIGSRSDLRCAAAARVVMADLTYAQNLAISTQKTTYVRFGTNTYSIYDTATGTTPITHPINKGPYTITLGANGTNGLESTAIASKSFDGQAIVAFDELGAPYAYNSVSSTQAALAASGSIVVQSGTYQLTIHIEPFTGDVTVTKG